MGSPFAYLAVAAPLHDARATARILDTLRPGLERLGGTASEDGGASPRHPFVVLALTGGVEERLLRAWRERRDVVPWEPFVVVAHPSHNSLPAAMETVARVHQDGGRARIVYVASPDDDAGWSELASVLDALRVRHALGEIRLGLVGNPSDWLVASAPPFSVVEQRWGPVVVPIDIGDALARWEQAHAPRPLVTSVVGEATGLREPGPQDVDRAVRVLPVLQALVAENRLDALTVRCFDLVAELHTSGCIALADLNDQGVTAGCEGDLVSAVGMTWVRLLLDEVAWMANPARVDVARNRVLLAHCTIARSLVAGYRLRSHFESGLGVGIEGDLDSTEVTLVRIGGRDMEKLWLAEGDVVPVPHDDGLCRTQVEVRLTDASVRDLLRAPLGNHLVVVPGRHAARLREWWELVVADPV